MQLTLHFEGQLPERNLRVQLRRRQRGQPDTAVELVENVEVIFRRRGREMLIVARGGKIIVRA